MAMPLQHPVLGLPHLAIDSKIAIYSKNTKSSRFLPFFDGGYDKLLSKGQENIILAWLNMSNRGIKIAPILN